MGCLHTTDTLWMVRLPEIQPDECKREVLNVGIWALAGGEGVFTGQGMSLSILCKLVAPWAAVIVRLPTSQPAAESKSTQLSIAQGRGGGGCCQSGVGAVGRGRASEVGCRVDAVDESAVFVWLQPLLEKARAPNE